MSCSRVFLSDSSTASSSAVREANCVWSSDVLQLLRQNIDLGPYLSQRVSAFFFSHRWWAADSSSFSLELQYLGYPAVVLGTLYTVSITVTTSSPLRLPHQPQTRLPLFDTSLSLQRVSPVASAPILPILPQITSVSALSPETLKHR